MSDLLQLMQIGIVCGTVLMVTFVVLLALPQSRMRSVCLEVMKYGIAGGCVLLTVSPIDVIPDFLPVLGWADDVGYVVGTVSAIGSAVRERSVRAKLPR
ncbi:MAG: YkvA family protein [Phycisphaerae bacterium]|nr:YkvA family protein [Phycisphaerae bacterium]